MANDYDEYATGSPDDEGMPTQQQGEYENNAYNTSSKSGGIPDSFWQLFAMKGMGGTPFTDLRRTRHETWPEESMRKIARAFTNQKNEERARQMAEQALAAMNLLQKPVETYSDTTKVHPITGRDYHPMFFEHPHFGTYYRAKHILGKENYEGDHTDISHRVIHPLILGTKLEHSPFGEKGDEPVKRGDRFRLLHMLMSGRDDEETRPFIEKYMRNPYISGLVNTFGYNKDTDRYFLRNPGQDFFKPDKSKYASKRFPYNITGKFMNALGSVSNKEIPKPMYREISSNDTEREKTSKNIFNRHLRNASSYSVPAIAAARTLGGVAVHALKGVAPLAAPTLGALAGIAAPLAISALMHKYADSRTNSEMKNRRFGVNPYDLIKRGY